MGNPGRFRLLACMILALGLAAQERPPLADDEAARSAAILAWHGGYPSPAYLDFKAGVARQEAERWSGRLLQGRARLSAPAGSTWSNLGPFEGANAYAPAGAVDSGRPTAIVPHPANPRVLFLGTAGGGVWRCQNADPASVGDWVWEPLTDALPAGTALGNLSVGALAPAVDQPNTLYLSLGDAEAGSADGTADGRGFYISDDGGDSWIRGGDLGPVMTRTKSIVSLPAGVVLVSGNGGLYRSSDRGRSFQPVAVPGFATLTSSLLALPGGTVLLTGRSTAAPGYGAIWFSSDAGLSWTLSAKDDQLAAIPLSRITLAVSAGSPNLVRGIAGNGSVLFRGLLRSEDGGRHWSYQPDPNLTLFGSGGDGAQGNYNQLLAVDPADGKRIFVGANLGLWRSLDGGGSWTRIANWVPGSVPYGHADWHVAAWSGTGQVLFLGNDGGLAVLRDPFRGVVPAGEDLSFLDHRRGKGLSTHLIYHLGSTIAASPADARAQVTIGLQDNGVWSRTGADLAHSSAWTGATGGDGFGTLIHPKDGNLVLASSQGLNLYRSTDRTNFDDANTGIDPADPKPFLSRLALGYADPGGNLVYTASLTHLYRSFDFGANWSVYPTPGLSLANLRYFNSALADPGAVAIIDSATGYVTYSGGASWSAFGSVPNSMGYYGYVWFSTEAPRTLYLTSVAFSATSSHLWRSLDGGASWSALDRGAGGGDNGLPFGIPVHIVQNDPLQSGVLYAGTDFGVYRSDDAGASWARFGGGLPLISVRDFYLAPDGSFLRAASHGRGVWEISLNPVPEPPRILRDPASLTLQAGEAAAFGVTCVAVPAPTFQWYRDGLALAGATRSTLVLSAVALADNGAAFTVQVANSQGALRSQAAILTVLPVQAPVILVQPAAQVVDAGQPASFGVTVTGVQLDFQWRRNGIDLPGATGASLSLPAVAAGDSGDRYAVQVRNPGGAVLSREAYAIGVPARNLIQNGGFENGSAGWQLTSSKGNVSMLIGGPERAFSGQAAADLGRWRRGPNYDRVTQAVTLPAGFQSGTLSFWVMLGSTTKPYDSAVADTFKARLLDAAGAPLSELFSIDHRFGGTPSQPSSWYHAQLPFTVAAGARALQVQFEAFEEGVTSFTGFQLDEVELLAQVAGAPVFSRQPVAAAGAPGQALTLSAAAGGEAPLSFLWLKDGNLVPGAAGAELLLPALATADAGEYQCLAFNPKGLAGSDKVRVGVLPAGAALSRVAITFPLPGTVFHGLYLASGLQVEVTGSGAYDPKVQWRVVAGQGFLSIHPNTGELVYNTPPWSGQVTLEARSLQDPTRFDQVTFGIDTVTGVQVRPANARLARGRSVALAASVIGGGFFDPAVQWSLVSGGGRVAPDGTFTAGTGLGVSLVRATSVQSPGHFAETAVTVAATQGPDFDGDGKAEILWRHAATGALYRMPVDGPTVLPGAVFYREPRAEWQIVASADCDGDGKADLLWWNSATGQVYQMLMAGGSIKAAAMIYTEPDTAWKPVGAGDFDGAGKASLLWRHAVTGAVYRMPLDGATVLPGTVIYTEPRPEWRIAAIADFDGDGKADLLWWNANTGQVYQMLMDGSAVKAAAMIYTEPDTAWRIVGAGDFDGDGRADLLWRNRSTGAVHLMPLAGATVLPGSVIYSEPRPEWQIAAIADYDGDGKADLLWWNSATGQVYQMLLDGFAIRSAAMIYVEPDTAWGIVAGGTR